MPKTGNSYSGRRPKKQNRKPDANGNIKITMNVVLSEDVYNYLIEKGGREMKSLSTMASLQLRALKEDCERLGL